MKTFAALTTGVAVSIDDALPLADVARAIIENYAPAESAELSYVLEPGGIRRNDDFLAVEQPMDVTPTFELDLYEQVVTRAAPGWILHAAAIDVGGRALVLAGSSGAGKTTLALALLAEGFRLLTEEIVWIGPDGTVRGVPRALHVPEGEPLHARIPATWRRLPYPIRDRAGARREGLLVVPPREVMLAEPRPLGAIVRIGHGADWDVKLEQRPPSEALQRLWDRSLRRHHDDLAVATGTLSRYPSFVLSSTTETEALDLLRPLLK